MLNRKHVALLLVPSLVMLSACAGATALPQPPAAQSAPGAGSPAAHAYDRLPLYFVENRGQTDPAVAYYVPGHENTLYFTSDGITLAFTGAPAASAGTQPLAPSVVSLPGADVAAVGLALPGSLLSVAAPAETRWTVKLDFVGANPGVRPVGENPTSTVFSYFHGQPSQWQAGVPAFTQLRYHNLWPGIDLVYSGQSNQLKYECVVQPGADPAQIRLAYRGASGVRITPDGQLEVSTPLIRFSDAAPMAYQEQAGQRVPVAMSYALQASTSGGPAASYGYGFHLGAYDRSRPVILDPTVLVYAGYIGGADLDSGSGIAVDSNGNAYITGLTQSPGTFPAMVGPDLTFHGGEDAFVAKVNASGTALVYAGYLGGTGDDEGNSIAVDSNDNAYVTGVTSSSDFPVSGGLSHTYGGGASDAFVAKVSADGTHLVYSGYIGGSAKDVGNSIAVDVNGNAYVAGFTLSSQTTFPVKGGPDLTYGGGTDFGDAFVAEVSADGSGLVYNGYIGGAGDDSGNAITVDGSGNVFVAGFTNSRQDTFPVKVGPGLTFNNLSGGEAFVAEVAAGGASLVYCGYIGGAGTDSAKGIAIDTGGNAYVTGETSSSQSSFPVKVGPSLTYSGNNDAFVAKVHTGGASLDYAGYIGGSGTDEGLGIVVDNGGTAYVSGSTNSTESSFPVVGGPSVHYGGGLDDAFVAKVNASGSALLFAGYIGGAGTDIGGGIALGQGGSVYLTGQTFSDQSTFPVTTGPYRTYGGNGDAFVAKVISFVPTNFVYLPLIMR
jgi:hypothetical protein